MYLFVNFAHSVLLLLLLATVQLFDCNFCLCTLYYTSVASCYLLCTYVAVQSFFFWLVSSPATLQRRALDIFLLLMLVFWKKKNNNYYSFAVRRSLPLLILLLPLLLLVYSPSPPDNCNFPFLSLSLSLLLLSLCILQLLSLSLSPHLISIPVINPYPLTNKQNSHHNHITITFTTQLAYGHLLGRALVCANAHTKKCSYARWYPFFLFLWNITWYTDLSSSISIMSSAVHSELANQQKLCTAKYVNRSWQQLQSSCTVKEKKKLYLEAQVQNVQNKWMQNPL